MSSSENDTETPLSIGKDYTHGMRQGCKPFFPAFNMRNYYPPLGTFRRADKTYKYYASAAVDSLVAVAVVY
jgi:hypothetical protein